ncbi:hypothetical protein [Campylobacter sp. MIT 97-5078]|uniref:hypothetical protein n=1 Tax=Campylobacter sp. MIT 97-5078 TaxID=1548153 RepID=UPI000514374B|nr:hypothetical protein [Campylobacter sp. MIT 97-5078]KGI56228.1 hypothetical protein LR59_08215 [Campylobacter sp. MIT 97-5078]TQR27252.1 hypothetical protein DMB91_04445 [Campylobacter sp. MIT 97-5078]
MFFSLRRYMLQLIVCVVFESKTHIIRAHSIKNKKIINTYEKQFEDKEKLFDYLKNLVKEYQLHYIAVFFNAPTQGLIPTNDTKEFARFGVNAENISCLSLANAQIYTSLANIKECKESFKDYGGLDFIFSPLSLLYYCIKQQAPRKGIVLYAYRQTESVAMMVCKEKEILFGSFFDINFQDDATTLSSQEKSEENNPEEDIDIENYDFGNLDNLLDEKLDDLKYSAITKEDLSHFSSDMNMYSYIFSSIQEFYNNPLYKGNFIDEFVIFDNENISAVVLDYIEGEIFIRPQVIQIDTLDLMHKLACKELKI